MPANRPKRIHNLKRIKFRQDWNKFNLYNLSRMRLASAAEKTYFQQKWAAKSATRAYHGDTIKEKHWKRMFTSRLPAVVPMDHRYLAQHDGSEQAEGRGSGQDENLGVGKPKRQQVTPYMQMTYWPTERRLDTAIWRALFASSTRQARQMVVHGHVKVNGQKMRYPGYLLNPGDMFQVDTDRVMWATGARKGQKDLPPLPSYLNEDFEPTEIDAFDEHLPEDTTSEVLEEAEGPAVKDRLMSLMRRTKEYLDDNIKDLSVKRKQALRAFHGTVRRTLSKYKTTTPEVVDGLDTEFSALTLDPNSKAARAAENTSSKEELDDELAERLKEALDRIRQKYYENPVDKSKPYLTPWRPRDYMSAFAFIPRYLEVNQNICAAVYLRHPAARPSLAEVPTPFHTETSQLAFNWYLRRR